MPILVQKYGGSSVSSLEKIRQVAKKVVAAKRHGYEVVVVVSAMGGTTDDLLKMAQTLSFSPSPRELDMLLSVGERISMTLLSIAIQEEGVRAISLTGSQCGIITTASHSNARIIDVRPFRVQDELALGQVVIVAGYQGTSYKREVTTLGRGGSDTTAVALAAALGAEACEIYSDVDGIYSADPHVVLDARRLAQLSYEEMIELSRSGARVLNQEAVSFARNARIALYAKSTHVPTSTGSVIGRPDGFLEGARQAEEGCTIKAVSHMSRGLWLSTRCSAQPLLALWESHTFVFQHWDIRTQGFDAFLDLENHAHMHELIERVMHLGGGETECKWQGLVSVVGKDIGTQHRWASRLTQSLRYGGIEPMFLSSQSERLSWVLPMHQVEQAARVLHAVAYDEP